MLDIPAQLDTLTAGRLLGEDDTDAFACLVAVSALVGDDFLDDEGQPLTETELREMIGPGVKLREENLTRVCGLLHAIAGDEFTQDATHFKRLVCSIVEGDPFQYEEDDEDPTLPDLYWAMYQVGLTTEDDIVDELGSRVQKYIMRLADEEVEDNEAMAADFKAEIEAGGTPEEMEPYLTKILRFRRAKLAKALHDMRCKAEWVQDLDPDLAESMARAAG